MSSDFSLSLSPSSCERLAKFLDHSHTGLVESPQNFQRHWLEDQAFSLAQVAILPPLLLISVLQSMPWFSCSLIYELGLETRNYGDVETKMTTSLVVRNHDVRWTAVPVDPREQSSFLSAGGKLGTN